MLAYKRITQRPITNYKLFDKDGNLLGIYNETKKPDTLPSLEKPITKDISTVIDRKNPNQALFFGLSSEDIKGDEAKEEAEGSLFTLEQQRNLELFNNRLEQEQIQRDIAFNLEQASKPKTVSDKVLAVLSKRTKGANYTYKDKGYTVIDYEKYVNRSNPKYTKKASNDGVGTTHKLQELYDKKGKFAGYEKIRIKPRTLEERINSANPFETTSYDTLSNSDRTELAKLLSKKDNSKYEAITQQIRDLQLQAMFSSSQAQSEVISSKIQELENVLNKVDLDKIEKLDLKKLFNKEVSHKEQPVIKDKHFSHVVKDLAPDVIPLKKLGIMKIKKLLVSNKGKLKNTFTLTSRGKIYNYKVDNKYVKAIKPKVADKNHTKKAIELLVKTIKTIK